MGRAYQNRKLSMAKTAAMKTAVYSRYSREIYVSAKAGGTGMGGGAARDTCVGFCDSAKGRLGERDSATVCGIGQCLGWRTCDFKPQNVANAALEWLPGSASACKRNCWP